MIFEFADWRFQVDVEKTRQHTRRNASDHCACAYCRNYYEALPGTYPGLCVALNRMGIDPMGPSELMPFTPTVYLACYRVYGEVLQWGKTTLTANGIPLVAETAAETGTFLLWVGEMELPWNQPEPMDDVISPANQPEFLLRMNDKWAQLNGVEVIYS